MEHKVKVVVERKKQGLFGKKTEREVMEVWVDEATYRKLKKEHDDGPFTVDELMLYDEIFDEWE